MAATVSLFTICYVWDFKVWQIKGRKRSKQKEKNIGMEVSLKENYQTFKDVSLRIWGTSEIVYTSDECGATPCPCRRGNMAAVTNKESHMPLFSFMFKYKHRLECISARYFQLSRVNLYLLTFMDVQLEWHFAFSYFKHYCTSEGKEKKITTVSSNFYVGVLDSSSLGVYGAHC